MKKSSIIKVLQSIPLFSVLDADTQDRLIAKSEVRSYLSGEKILAPDAITLILKGSVTVTKQTGEKNLLMRILGQGSVSGVASLFSESHDSLSVLTAVRATEVLMISHQTVQQLISENSDFALKYISFLTSRIRFLNGRIKAYTVGDTEAKLALHLLLSDESENGEIELPVSLTALADMLDMGRASLYRALDSLVQNGIIAKNGRKIKLLDRVALRKKLSE